MNTNELIRVKRRKKEIEKMRMSGITLQKIGAAFGISKQRVHQILIKS